jgi:predicted nucleic acid-binding protein
VKFIDTNIFVRVLTGDDPAKAAACQRLFRALESGAEEAMTSESVMAEVVYVLASPRHYRFDRTEIAEALSPYFRIRGLRIPDRSTLGRALSLYGATSGLDFEDAITAVRFGTRGIDAIVSYDRGFDRLPGVVRIEPD